MANSFFKWLPVLQTLVADCGESIPEILGDWMIGDFTVSPECKRILAKKEVVNETFLCEVIFSCTALVNVMSSYIGKDRLKRLGAILWKGMVEVSNYLLLIYVAWYFLHCVLHCGSIPGMIGNLTVHLQCPCSVLFHFIVLVSCMSSVIGKDTLKRFGTLLWEGCIEVAAYERLTWLVWCSCILVVAADQGRGSH
mmetsp:Transcript_47006/g.87567  ORF Transcript_47006/g.87567 Transcript_47006/m.87567 type:complete len:195 (-) Transcript_47006:254-838(-)